MSWHVYHVGYGTILLFPNHWIRLHLASIFFQATSEICQLLRAEDTNQASYLHLNLSICGQPGQTQGFLFGPMKRLLWIQEQWDDFFFPSKSYVIFQLLLEVAAHWAHLGSGVGQRWGWECFWFWLLSVRTIFFTLRIKLEDKCLGILLSIFHGCGIVVSSVGNWCPRKCFNFIIYELGDGNQHILNNFCMPGTMLDALPCLNSLNLNSWIFKTIHWSKHLDESPI